MFNIWLFAILVTWRGFRSTDLALDAMDVSGESQIDIDAHLLKQRLDLQGKPISETPEQHSKTTLLA